MPTFLLDLEFDGRGFAGTAPQTGQRTLTRVLREALGSLGESEALTRTCGRLDAGVSARSIPTSCILQRDWQAGDLGLALNSRLPADLKVLRVAPVQDGFDALANATGKTYVYRILHRATAPAFDGHLHWLWGRFEQNALDRTATAIVGRHDLAAFACLRGDDSDKADATRTIHTATWTREAYPGGGSLFTFRISGEGFLYKQVRGLVGAMIAVAQGSETVERFITRIGAARSTSDEDRIGQVAPAVGLYLAAAEFDPQPVWSDLR